MKNQKLGMDLEKVERKAVDREKQLEQTFKKSENDFKLKNDKLSEQIEKLTSSMESLNQKYSD
jgi:phage-related minor tail protein